MYVDALDSSAGLLVGFMTMNPSYDEDADYEQHLAHASQLEREANARTKTGAMVILVDADCPRPSARWRKRIAEARNAARFEHFYFALVTTSLLVRGALTAIRWVQRETPAFQSEAFATFADADAWIVRKLGAPGPELRRLHDQCVTELAARRAGVSARAAR
jgi:hypothetical protein